MNSRRHHPGAAVRRAVLGGLGALMICTAGPAGAAEAPPDPVPPERVRELLVPLDDLHLLLESEANRVLLPRAEFEALRERAEREEAEKPPIGALLADAEYRIRISEERAAIRGTFVVEAMDEGVHAVALPIGEVGLQSLRCDGTEAPLGRGPDGRLTLFVEGPGRRTHELTAVAPVAATAARQVVRFELPMAGATRLEVAIDGDVEVRSGAAVVRRTFDEKAEETRIDVLAQPGPVALVMTLNSRLKRKERAVVARGVLVNEVTEVHENLYAAMSFDILHSPVEQLSFRLPPEVEITDVQSVNLATWAVRDEGADRVLDVHLREETEGRVMVSLTGLRTGPPLDGWDMPLLQPLDVLSYSAVVGLLADMHLEPRDISADGLIPIDTTVLRRALPAQILQREPGAVEVRPVATFYAPSSAFSLGASFVRPEAKLFVTSHLVLGLGKNGLRLQGGLNLRPREETLHDLGMVLPSGWDLLAITSESGAAVPHEVFREASGTRRVVLQLPEALAPGAEQNLVFEAEALPPDWLGEWDAFDVSFPAVQVIDAARDMGAVAMRATDDLRVRVTQLDGLTPLDANERKAYGLRETEVDLAYRFEQQPYSADLRIERIPPRLTAQTFAFFNVGREAIRVRYEVVYEVDDAAVEQVELSLPADTPAAVSIQGLGGAVVKEYTAALEEDRRRWTALLAEPRRDRVHLAVELQLPPAAEGEDLQLPMVLAEGVAYQSGQLAIESEPDLDLQVLNPPRRVDVGELADAEYEPGARLTGAYGFVGTPPVVQLAISQPEDYGLPSTLIERAELHSTLSPSGVSQTDARFLLRSKAMFLEVKLPPESVLWSAMLDDRPAKPQRQDGRILLELPAGEPGVRRALRVVYETPVSPAGYRGTVRLPAPELYFQDRGEGTAGKIPLTDLQWQVFLPNEYTVTSSRGTVHTARLPVPEPAAVGLARGLYRAGGGIDTRHGLIRLVMAPFASVAGSARMRSKMILEAEYQYDDAVPVTMGVFGVEDMDETREMAQDPFAPSPEGEAQAVVPPQSAQTAAPVQQREVAEQKLRTSYGGKRWALQGLSGLNIALVKEGRSVTFTSLGEDPVLDLVLTNTRRRRALETGIALLAFLVGASLVAKPPRVRIMYIAALLLAATVLPALPGLLGWTRVLNQIFYAACWLVPFYLAIGILRRARLRLRPALPAGVAATLTLLLLAPLSRAADADDTFHPVDVPADAILVPYSNAPEGDRIMVPLGRYEGLREKAYPDEKSPAPPADFALSGASYEGRLEGEEILVLHGVLDIEVYREGNWSVPLPLQGGVLVSASLDGETASVQVEEAAPVAGQKGQRRNVAALRHLLRLDTPGRHQLALEVQVSLARQGGWRVVDARLPHAAATTVRLTVPDAGTEVNVSGGRDRERHNATADGEVIETALADQGRLQLRWRPEISEGDVDRTLTAESSGLFALREDALRLDWELRLGFRRGERDAFRVTVPSAYTVEQVAGDNVRGWELNREGERQVLHVQLLKPARESEQFTLRLRADGPDHTSGAATVRIPYVDVPDAIRHTGQIGIRRSAMLDVRNLQREGLQRIGRDAGTEQRLSAGTPDESPLGVRPYQSYSFVSIPYSLTLQVEPVVGSLRAETRTILRLAERERRVESRIEVHARKRPVHRLDLRIPAGFDIDAVTAPGTFEWVLDGARPEAPRLVLHFAAGLEGAIPVLLTGVLPGVDTDQPMDLPHFEVEGAEENTGTFAVQADPGFDVLASDLDGVEPVLLRQVQAWLNAEQRALTRLALGYRDPGYRGALRLVTKAPQVTAYSLTNVRVTDRTIAETMLLNFSIRQAGIRRLRFRMPAYLRDARIRVPLLREKHVADVPGSDDEVEVTLDLQDAAINELRVLVESDRMLSDGDHRFPFPTILTGRTDRRYAVLENAGRDEVVLTPGAGVEPLTRQQREWATVASVLGGTATRVFLADPDASAPELVFATRQRAEVETVGARIGLARTTVLMDANGAYRGRQVLNVDNRTEHYLAVQLPPGASLWTARVAGELVKPLRGETDGTGEVWIPLVRTARGDLDYPVELIYGGRTRVPRTLARQEVPLPATRNVEIQLSQVEVRLPVSHRWLHFGGTMRHVEVAGELEAGQLQYKNTKANELLHVLKYGSNFEQARAASNLRTLQREIQVAQDWSAINPQNEFLNTEISNAGQLLQETDRELAETEKQLGDLIAGRGNRDAINDAYLKQTVAFTRNTVINKGDNWTDQVEVAVQDAPMQDGSFNSAWFDANGLLVMREQDEKAGAASEEAADLQVQQVDQLFSNQAKQSAVQRQAGADTQVQYLNTLQKRLAQQPDDQGQGQQASTRQTGREETSRRQLRLYQEKLAKKSEAALYTVTRGRGGAVPTPGAGQGFTGDDQGFAVQRMMGQPQAANLPFAGAVVAPRDAAPGIGIDGSGFGGFGGGGFGGWVGGLRGLDVHLPGADDARWVVHHFTTPRGDTVIRALPLGVGAAARAGRLALAVALVTLAWVVYALWRRGLSRAGVRRLTTAVILLGITGLLVGFFPLASLVGLVAAVAFRFARLRTA